MNNKVKFLRGTSNEYAVAEKDNDTIYFTTNDGKLYIGDKKISGDGSLTIDDTLSDTSTNPVQNKVVKQAIDNKADKSLYGDTTINVGRKAGTTVGDYSTAEGLGTTASGEGSHAEGLATKATGRDSHAEGVGSIASGENSHAGGGYSQASGISSFSHGIGTFAYADGEVVFGKYNISRHGTLFSIGDGTADDARHNAFEITTTGGKLHDKDIATTDLISNPNLLINPDFKINQRRLSSYNADWNHTVDRWIQFGAVVSPNSSGGINISKRDEADYFGFIQRTEILQSDCNSKSMTLSAKINGEVLSGTIIRSNVEQVFFNIGNSSDRFIISSYSNNDIKYIIVQLYGSKSYNIEWVKLEYGSVATPFVPPNPTIELLKCQRYYQVRSENNIAVIDLRPNMRDGVVPTITALADGNYSYEAEL